MTPTYFDDTLRRFVIEYPYHYCHMTTDMIQLSYDNERELNDGRRTSPVVERAWMEPVQAHSAHAGFLLCSEMETRAGLHHFGNEVVRIDQRKSSGEDRGCFRAVNIFSAATRSTPIDWNPLSAERSQSLLHVYYTCELAIWQHAIMGYEVADREDLPL